MAMAPLKKGDHLFVIYWYTKYSHNRWVERVVAAALNLKTILHHFDLIHGNAADATLARHCSVDCGWLLGGRGGCGSGRQVCLFCLLCNQPHLINGNAAAAFWCISCYCRRLCVSTEAGAAKSALGKPISGSISAINPISSTAMLQPFH